MLLHMWRRCTPDVVLKTWRQYTQFLEKYSQKKVAITTGGLMGLGDALSQVCVEKNGIRPGSKYDVVRTVRFASFGTLIIGPMYGVWYRYLADTFTAVRLSCLKMVVFDQLLFAPPFLAFFIMGVEVFKGTGPSKINKKLKEDFEDVMVTNYQLWPAVQALNFSFIPVQHRVLVINVVAIGWNTYLAWKAENQAL